MKVDGAKRLILVFTPSRTWVLRAKTLEECQTWLRWMTTASGEAQRETQRRRTLGSLRKSIGPLLSDRTSSLSSEVPTAAGSISPVCSVEEKLESRNSSFSDTSSFDPSDSGT